MEQVVDALAVSRLIARLADDDFHISGVPFLQVGGCRYIVRGAGVHAIACDHDIVIGSYCAHHARRCFNGRDYIRA